MKRFKIQTQKGLVTLSIHKDPERWFLVSDFCGGDQSLPYIGYKVAARMGEMQKSGYLTSRWSDRRTVLGTKTKEYRLARNKTIEISGEYIVII